MSSLLTNSSAMVALTTLRGINDSMATTQNRISTGMRVADASDNAAYWSIATTMKSDNSALSAVKDSLGLGAATVDVAFTAMDQTVEIVSQIKDKLTAATNGTVDREKIQADVEQLQKQLETIASSATFSGENWLQQDMATDALNKEIAGSFTRDAAGNTQIENIVVDTRTTVLVDTRAAAADNTGILTENLAGGVATVAHTTPGDMSTLTVTAAGGDDGIISKATEAAILKYYEGLSDADKLTFDATAALASGDTIAEEVTAKLETLSGAAVGAGVDPISFLDLDISTLGNNAVDNGILAAYIDVVDGQLSAITDAATELGSAKSRVDMQKEFASNLSDAIDRGIGQLVDADMNAESTRLQALQTQQQLGIQALSIANSGSQNILSLFR
ncbi:MULTISPECIES: flagellin [unclassified Pseudovibrio]|uniref:flagellin N-terminal helical domain-containing protein n=1 Tax=unclassified Pseudovibrio TaxID=2627060 RepID=UPI0007AEC4C1|nr:MULTISPECIES: flagellin [unclassified Pseudovibrio]KZK95988.1 Flagellin [Pseudovibrio sp. W74]KZL08577.1 Flagellin [Pseudovibrio sp. Ad14]